MCHLLAPMAVAAWEYSSFLISSASPLIIRALPNQPVTPMMTIKKRVEREKTEMRVMSRKSSGIERNASSSRIIRVSTIPPRKPAIMPYRVPTTIVMTPASMPRLSEYSPPNMIRPSSSNPELSVPSRCFAEGGWLNATLSAAAWFV